MQRLRDLIAKSKSGVAQLALASDGNEISTGSGFIVGGKLVTNAHVLPTGRFEKVKITIGGALTGGVEFTETEIASRTTVRSEATQFDYVVLELPESMISGHHRFSFAPCEDIVEGDEVLFFGFPFGTKNLTAHAGHISSAFTRNGIHEFQIDGSINPGNSGGPLIKAKTGDCIGIVTRTQTGLAKDFDALVDALDNNLRVLSSQRSLIQIGGIDPIKATSVTMASLRVVALNLKRTANVGIGYAFCAEHILAGYNFNA